MKEYLAAESTNPYVAVNIEKCSKVLTRLRVWPKLIYDYKVNINILLRENKFCKIGLVYRC